MSLQIWLYRCEGAAGEYVRALTGALRTVGVEVVERGADASLLGIVLFAEASAELSSEVQELSREGLDRLIAVAVTEEHVSGAVAWPLRRAGACDVLAGSNAHEAAKAIAFRAARWLAIGEMLSSPAVSDMLIGQSPAWVLALRQIAEAAAFTDGSILLLGESGTGKELLARMIHALDRRPGKRSLVVLDCTTVVPELAGSEFFGHERGAFTGAAVARDGSFALADGGTLFLDEVGELPLPMQAQLLRVVQERTYKRVGSNDWMRANFRLIAATNRDLDSEVAGGGFRRDLFHRIASRVFRVPPLRSRTADILPLVQHFLSEMHPSASDITLDPAVREYLLTRAYPGNVRELRQLVCRMNDRWSGHSTLTVGAIPLDEVPGASDEPGWKGLAFDQAIRTALEFGVGLHEIKEAAGSRALALAIEMEEGSTRGAATRLSVTERTIQMHRAERRAAK